MQDQTFNSSQGVKHDQNSPWLSPCVWDPAENSPEFVEVPNASFVHEENEVPIVQETSEIPQEAPDEEFQNESSDEDLSTSDSDS